MQTVCLCVLGRKGGTGKSTVVTSLAGVLARNDQRVLIIDLDGQGSASIQ